MSASAAVGALLGLTAACGVLLVGDRVRALRLPSLADRLGPAARRRAGVASGPSDPHGPLATLVVLLRPGAVALEAVVDRRGGGRSALLRRLQRAGRPADVERHRVEQIVWAAVGLGLGTAGALLVLVRGGEPSPGGLLVLTLLTAVGAVLAHDRLLTRAGRRRAARIAEQLPAVADLLAFAVAAGESPAAALDRVARTVRGDLADELLVAGSDVRAGRPWADALRLLADRCGSPAVDRFVDGLRVAADRGTPLADVLRAQAADARAAARRRLLESAGRKDVAMLLPVVFVVLPIVVVVALYPGIHGLELAVP